MFFRPMWVVNTPTSYLYLSSTLRTNVTHSRLLRCSRDRRLAVSLAVPCLGSVSRQARRGQAGSQSTLVFFESLFDRGLFTVSAERGVDGTRAPGTASLSARSASKKSTRTDEKNKARAICTESDPAVSLRYAMW